MEPETKRSTAQNKALHKLFTDISNHCVSVGLDQKTIVNRLDSYDVPTTPQFVKDVWRTIQYPLTGKISTADLDKKEVNQVYDVFNKFWSELTGEHFTFPSYEAMMRDEWYDR